MTPSLRSITIWLSAFVFLGNAQNITTSTCASPDGFNTCFQPVTNTYLDCIAKAGNDVNQRAACLCKQNAGLIDCGLENCWNVVYGCEYQSVAKSFYQYCDDTADFPFFPAPDNAPGGCSCNLGYVIRNLTDSLYYVGTCTGASTDSNKINGCQCCKESGAYTALYDICPGVDPSLLEYPGLGNLLAIPGLSFDQCPPYLQRYDCVKDLGYEPIGTLPFLTSLPASTGTKSFSVTGGGGITTPLSGGTYTWTALGTVRTITAGAAGKAVSSATPTTSSGGASTTRSVLSTRSNAGTATTSTLGSSSLRETSQKITSSGSLTRASGETTATAGSLSVSGAGGSAVLQSSTSTIGSVTSNMANPRMNLDYLGLLNVLAMAIGINL